MTLIIDELVEKIKAANPVEDVIGDDFKIKGHGQRLSTIEHDSLQIYVNTQTWKWYSQNTRGDVITWVRNQKGYDFVAACEYLCKRGGLPPPEWKSQDPIVRVSNRQREDVATVATDLFHKILWLDATALNYCHGRGWTDETIKEANLGFTGRPQDKPKLRRQLIDAFGANGIDYQCPAAVAVIGFNGDVKHWAIDWGITPAEKWIEQGFVWGAVGWGRLVYAHMIGARCNYFSLRDIETKEHYNPPSELMGERKIYANWLWSKSENICVVVEGQADVVTLGQWRISGLTFNGVAANEKTAKYIGANKENRKAIFYLGLDSDKAGSFDSFVSELDVPDEKKVTELHHLKKPTNTLAMGRLLGPTTYMLEWEKIGKEVIGKLELDESIKDANDVLKAARSRNISDEVITKTVGGAVNSCSSYFIGKFCELAGKEAGARSAEAIKQAVDIIADMDEMSLARTQGELARLLKIDQRELKRMIKVITNEDKKKDDHGENVVYTMGGYIKGWVVEYFYDPEDGMSSLAWREPNRNIGAGYSVMIEGIKYAAMPPTETIKKGGVQFASKLVSRTETRVLAMAIEMFIKRVFLLSNPLFVKIISYYVLLTWVYDCFPAIPYLRASGEPGSGKSELMKRVGLLCYRTMSSGGASSTSSLFRMVERYKGTVLMDEMDLKDSGASADIVKFLTEGSMEDGPIYRTEKVNIDGKEEFVETMFQTYCPKLICMQGDFFDKAVGSRCITFPVQPRETYELVDAGIPLERTKAMKAEAMVIRNSLFRWRLENWQPQREINPAFYNLNITARLNQVTVAIQMIAEDDPELRAEINKFMNEYHLYLIQDKAMSIEARIIEAMWKIYKFPDLHLQMVERDTDKREKIKVGFIKNIANEIMKEMNMDEDDDDSDTGEEKTKFKKKKRDAISAQMVGHRLREKLQFEITNRTSKGFFVIWDEKRMTAISKRYGVNPDDLGPDKKEEKAVQKPAETQATLLETEEKSDVI